MKIRAGIGWGFTLYLTVILILLQTSVFIWAGGNSTADFLKLDPGARPAGMAGAFTAAGNDADVIGFNPAGLAQIKTRQASFTHGIWIQDITYEYIAAAYPLTKQNAVLGAQLISLNYGEMDELGEKSDGTPDKLSRKFNASNTLVSLGVGLKLPNKIIVGATGKMVIQKIQNEEGSAIVADIGALYQLNPELKLGVAVQNVGTKLKTGQQGSEANLPMVVKSGAAYALDKSITLAVDLNYPLDGSALNVKPGLEYLYKSGDMTISLRGGYLTGSGIPDTGVTFGGGVQFKLIGVNVAYTPQAELGNILRVSLNLQL